MTVRLDSLIFDLDGTLWDVTAAVARARNIAMRKIGVKYKEISAADVARHIGLPVDEVYRRTYPDLSAEAVTKLREQMYAELPQVLRADEPNGGATLYPGVREGLSRLSGAYQLFIVSNCGKSYIESFLDWSGLAPMFTDRECIGNTGKSKAENIRLVAGRNHLLHPAYIGDTEGDQKSAKEAGVQYFHVNYGFGRPAEPCPSFDRFDELVEELLRTY